MTAAMLIVLSVLVAFSFASGISEASKNIIARLQKMSKEEFRKTVCPSLEKNNGLLKCAPENHNEKIKQATHYLKSHPKPQAASLDPLIILPGLGGSAMRAKLDNHTAPHWWCFSNWDSWFRLWLPLQELLAQDCWFDNLKVIYNSTTNEYDSPPGVTTDTMDFGGLSGIDYLDYWFGFPIPFTTYYSSFLESLYAVGYVPGVNLFGAPFDWRVPTSQHELDDLKFNRRLQELILNASKLNGNKPVTILSHSMGGHVALEFFSLQNQTWLDQYVKNFIPIAAPWAGAPKIVRTLLSGDNFGIEILGVDLLNVQKVKELARQGGGMIELLPFSAYYPSDQVFVLANNKQYTANDFRQLFNDAGTPVTSEIYDYTEKLVEDLKVPRVNTYCIYGDGVETEIFYNYTNGFDTDPVITYSTRGDGTVPIESLKLCNEWSAKQKQPVSVKDFNLIGHSDILHDTDVFTYIINILTNSKPLRSH